MTDTAIKVENLGKRYRTGQYVGSGASYMTLRESLTNAMAAPFRRLRQTGDRRWKTEEPRAQSPVSDPPSANPGLRSSVAGQPSPNRFIWALRDVSFEVKRGEVLGVIGRNGAGKSTLLKILTRITEPTEGRAQLNGRVGSLLEVGTGFHPELTGRENIYLSGTILGMTRKDVNRRFDEIVDFSGVETYIDTPVKRYSSGMRVRLGFAVAAHLEPEILLIDEVLAVGDAEFQKKCLGKMGDVANEGRTVLFVSHNMGMIRSICERCILLADGQILIDEEPARVVTYYLSSGLHNENAAGAIHWPTDSDAPGGEEMKLRSIRLIGPTGTVRSSFEVEDPIAVEITYEVRQVLRGMRLILQLLTQEGIVVLASTDHLERDTDVTPGRYTTVCTIPSGLLNRGGYLVKVHAGIPGVSVLVQGCEHLSFVVVGDGAHGSHFPEDWPGVVAPRLQWRNLWKGPLGRYLYDRSNQGEVA